MHVSTRFLASGGAVLLLAVSSCSKDDEHPELSVTVVETTGSPTVIPLAFAPPPPTILAPADYAFDFDAAQFMPTPPNMAPIPAPWGPGAVRAFSDDLRDDHRQADGWELNFSSFSNSTTSGQYNFILYNKYRGVIRYYFYIKSGVQNFRTYQAVASTLGLEGRVASTSPLLSFAAQSVVDPTKNFGFASVLEAAPLSDGTWYASQFELAFDQNIKQASFRDLLLKWYLTGSVVEGASLNSVPVGTKLPVGIQIEGADLGKAIFANYNGPVQLRLSGPASLASLQQVGFPTAAAQEVLALRPTTIGYSGVVPSQNAGTGALVQVPAQINFKVNSNVGLAALSLALPGYDNSSNLGLSPQYNVAPGVFFLSGRPVINAQRQAGSAQSYSYALDVPSVRYLFNPAVTQVADIRNLRQEIVAVGDSTVAAPTLYVGVVLTANRPLKVQGVRVSFDVVPKNGSASVRHIKTFRADIKQQ